MAKRYAIVYFYRSTDQHSLLFFLKRDFSHCDIVICEDDSYIMVEPLYSCTHIRCVSLELVEQFKRDCTIYRCVLLPAPPFKRLLRIRFISCVGILKHILGIRTPFIITPFQLYKYINRRIEWWV